MNDSLIEFAIEYHLQKELCDIHQLDHQGQHVCRDIKHIYTYSCLFFTKLFQEKDPIDAYQLVRRWTKNIDIFDKYFLFFPINDVSHFSLMVVIRPDLIEKYAMNHKDQQEQAIDLIDVDKDDNNNNNEEDEQDIVPVIIFMDSLNLHSKEKFGNAIKRLVVIFIISNLGI